MSDKVYLGDSVYAEIQDGMIKLTAENGVGPSNTIFLEAPVYDCLVEWVRQVRARAAARKAFEP